MKSRVVKLADYIAERTRENRGEVPTFHGPDGIEIPFTVENYRKLRDRIAKQLGIEPKKKEADSDKGNQ